MPRSAKLDWTVLNVMRVIAVLIIGLRRGGGGCISSTDASEVLYRG